MPLSPLTHILIALTLLAFPWAFVWLDAQGGGASGPMTGVSLTLLVATVFQLIRDGSAFDDRSFHRTRPGGEKRAFRRITRILLGIVAFVSLMPALRCLYFHLGWRSAIEGATVAFVPMLLLASFLATGFTLALQHARGVRAVVVTLIAIPAAVYLAPTAVYVLLSQWLGASTPGDWTVQMTWSGVIGAAGYSAAWWLAAGRRRWLPALVLAGVTGASVPLLRSKGPLVPPGDLPSASLELRRLPPFEEDRAIGRSTTPRPEDWGMKYRRVEGRLRAEGLQDDEYLAFSRLVSDRPDTQVGLGHFDERGGGWSSDSGLLRPTDSLFESAHQSLMAQLKARLPGEPEMTGSSWAREMENFMAVPRGQEVPDLEAMTWKIDGTLFRIETLGHFPVADSGSHRLPGGGVARVWPIQRNVHGIHLGFRLIVPNQPVTASRTEKGWSSYDHIGERSWLFLVTESNTKAVMLHENGGYPRRAFGSMWWDYNIVLHYPGNPREWTEEEILHSHLYLFGSRPVARIQASLPPVR